MKDQYRRGASKSGPYIRVIYLVYTYNGIQPWLSFLWLFRLSLFCGSRKMGHVHTVEECPALECVRRLPKYARIPTIPRFTRCTGIPTSQFLSEPVTWNPGALK